MKRTASSKRVSPLFNTSATIYNAAMAQGHAKEDTAAVCAVLEAMAGFRR